MKQFFALLFAFATLNTWAALPPESDYLSKPTTTKPFHIRMDGIYTFVADTEVIPEAVILNGEIEENPGRVSTSVHKGEAVAIEFLASGEILMTLRLPEEEAGLVPEQFVISHEEFHALRLQFAAVGTANDLKANYSGYFDTQVAGRGGRARARYHRHRQESARRGHRRDGNGRIAGGGGNCVSVVKSLTGFRGTAGNGVGMASALQRIGYSVVSFGGLMRGAVCSWSGGYHGKGHVGWFDGRCFQPTYGGNCGNPGRNYRLVKCVAKR